MNSSVEIEITTDPSRLDREATLQLLSDTHWASNRSREIILKSFENSLCFAAFANCKQVGFARVITDFATTAYLCDMVVDASLRGQGLGQKIVEAVLAEPSLKDLKWILRTRDAATLYARFGFAEAVLPGRYMEKTAGGRGWDQT
jgi:GNAT superfamily N-acetyltransferase